MWIGSVCVCVFSQRNQTKRNVKREKRNPIHQEQRTTTNFQVGWEKQWQERNLISTLTVSDDAVRFRLLLLLLLLLLLSLLESLQASDVNNGADFFDTAAPTTIIIRNVILFNFSRCRSMTVLAISIVFHADNEKLRYHPTAEENPLYCNTVHTEQFFFQRPRNEWPDTFSFSYTQCWTNELNRTSIRSMGALHRQRHVCLSYLPVPGEVRFPGWHKWTQVVYCQCVVDPSPSNFGMRDDHNSAWQVNAFGGCLYGGGAYRLNAAAWMRARAHIVWTPPTNRWYIWPTHLNVCMYARLIVIFRLVGVGAFYYHNQMKFWRLVFINRNAVWILKKRLMCTFEIRQR